MPLSVRRESDDITRSAGVDDAWSLPEQVGGVRVAASLDLAEDLPVGGLAQSLLDADTDDVLGVQVACLDQSVGRFHTMRSCDGCDDLHRQCSTLQLPGDGTSVEACSVACFGLGRMSGKPRDPCSVVHELHYAIYGMTWQYMALEIPPFDLT